jgi:predicted glycosyltransferase
MFTRRLYYLLKPRLPWGLRMGLRRIRARRLRKTCADSWPILESAGKKPEGWPGWPDGKQFAFVLTHDVEGPEGLAKVRPLAELEMRLGFRSCFNFIPEGEYRVPRELREWLVANGFEVGVHDLYHDGGLFASPETFQRHAPKINHYLQEWGAVGFRAGFMLRNLDWQHDLNVQWDACTFDTDPFEPQPDGAGTIFPFWVPNPNPSDFGLRTSDFPANRRAGYVELPYTLPQDSTLFLLLRETTPDIWLRKLDWIARHGGLGLLIVHPDYVRFDGEPWSPRTFPAEHYAGLLQHVRERYSHGYWHALPQAVAQFVSRSDLPLPPEASSAGPGLASCPGPKPKIWIDLDNTPHVPFFEPIIDELRVRGFPVLVTARDAFQVCDLADKKGLRYVKVGRHHGKHRLNKAVGLVFRALQLAPLVLREKPLLGVSHGARSQLLLSNLLRIPTLLIEDYEFAQFPPMMRPTWVMAPSVIPDAVLGSKKGQIRKYPGIKEDVYAWKLQPDPALLRELKLDAADLIVTVRPPATEAHYHNPESEGLFTRFMDRACATPGVRVVLLPRNARQGQAIRQQAPQWFEQDRSVIPRSALDGMNLIWHSDLVVSGGGTMNREAAALGVPVYSIFRGTIGAVDRDLCARGRLILVESLDDADRKILLVKRPRQSIAEVTSRRTLEAIVDTIVELAAKAQAKRV